MHCATCASDAVITIEMRIGGEIVRFHRCSTCESNAWAADDDEHARSLDEILDLARAH